MKQNSNKTISLIALVLAITVGLSSGWIHTHYRPSDTTEIGPASRTFLTMKAFTDIILQNMVLHQFDPDFKNIAITSMNENWNGLPIAFEMYMREAKVDPEQTTITQTNNTYVINSKNVHFSLFTHLNINGRNYDIPATTNNAEFSIYFELGFNEEGLIFVNSTETTIDVQTYSIPAGFFDPELDKNTAFVDVPLPEQFKHIPLDAINSVITASFEEQLTVILRNWLTDQQVYENISLDRNFTSFPSMAGGKVMIERNMFFYNNKQPKQRPNIAPPTYFPSKDDLSHKQEETLMVNEYFFNSLFYAMYDANMLQYTLTNNNIPIEAKQRLTVYQLDRLIPGLKDMFVYDYPMIAEFVTTAHPKTTILGEVFFLREPKVMTKVEGQLKLSVDTPNGISLIGVFDILTHVELSMRIDVNQLFLYFEDVQTEKFKVSIQGFESLPLNVDRIKNAVHRLFLQSIPRLTNFLMLNHGIKLMPFENVELINSHTDIAPNHISTQTDLFIYDINKNPFQSFPAMKLRVQNRLFDKLKDYLLVELTNKVRGMTFPDQYLGSKFGCSVDAKDLCIPQFSIDIANTYIRGNDDGAFNIHISQFNIEGKGKIRAVERIKIWKWKVKVFSITVGLDIKSYLTSFDAGIKIQLDSNGQLRPNLDHISINWDFSFKITGGLMAKIINFVVHHIGLHNTIRNTVVNKMRDAITNMIQNKLTSMLQTNYYVPVSDNLSLDFRNTISPIVKSQFIEFQSSFFFTPSNSHERPPFNPPTLPEIGSNDRDIEFLIHQYTLNSAGYFAFTQNKLNFVITHEMLQIGNKFNFTSTEFKWTIPGLYRKFGKDMKMNLGIESIFYPQINVTPQSISANIATLLDLQVRVPQFDAAGNFIEDEIYSAITIDCELEFGARIYEENGILKFAISQINFSKLEAFGAEVEPGILFRFFGHSTVNKILNFAIPFINEYVFANKGIDLNRVLINHFEISNATIQLNDNYIYIATDAGLV